MTKQKQAAVPEMKFRTGIHWDDVEEIIARLSPLTKNGTIPPCPGADYYAVSYDRLGAFKIPEGIYPVVVTKGYLIATWSAPVPGDSKDVDTGATYEGQWVPYTGRLPGAQGSSAILR